MNGPDLVVRAARAADLEVLLDFAQSVGSGMTSFPADPDTIAAKLHASLRSFAGPTDPVDAQYLLVMEDVDSGAVMGTAALYPSVGSPYGFFSYKVSRLVQRSRSLGRGVDTELLTLANDYTGATEVGTLILRPQLRGTGAARFLARSRYMMLAAFPQLFAPRVMAEMRGWQDDAGESPFWRAVGERFFHMEFDAADRLSAVAGAEFIAELMPKHPIYCALLPEAARQAIGRPHRASAPAMAMLLDEGFRYENHVDVFDAGPQVHAERDRIRTVAESRVRAVQPAAGMGDTHVLACTLELEDFRVVRARATLSEGGAALDDVVRRGLQRGGGAPVRVSPSHAAERAAAA